MLARGVSAVASVLAVLLACNPDHVTTPITSEILDTVAWDAYGAGSSSVPTAMGVSLSILGVGLDTTYARYAVFNQASIHDGDEGTVLVAKPDNDSDFRSLAALLTNGINDPLTISSWGGGGIGSVTSPESMFFGKTASSPDFAGYVLDSIQFWVDSVLIVSPGSDPYGTGNWTDYDLGGRWVFFGHRD